MDDAERLRLINLYYKNPAVLFEVVKEMGFREGCFLKIRGQNEEFMARPYNVGQVLFLVKAMDSLNFSTTPSNIYGSVARFNKLKFFTFDLKKKAEERKWMEDDWFNILREYDYLMDFDPDLDKIPDETHWLNEMKRQGLIVCNFFDDFNVKYSIRWSGKGLHIFVRGEEFNWLTLKEKPRFYSQLSKKIRAIFNVRNLDSSYGNKEIERRLFKIPYSLDLKKMRVCLPLTKQQLTDLSYEFVAVESVIRNQNLYKRGTLINNLNKESKLKELCESLL